MERGHGLANNYTPEVVDAVAQTIVALKKEYAPGITIIVGHSGGAAIAADLLGRHPNLVDGALLAACGCDPVDRRARWKAEDPDPILDEPNPSLLPLDMVATTAPNVKVRLIVGSEDTNAPSEYSKRYAEALRRLGIDAQLSIIRGQGHDILFSPSAFSELERLLKTF
jgi:pimeloyl-ACP methyl ester carboxylesterase